MRRFTLLATLCLALAAGCGGDDDESGGGGAATPGPSAESTPEAAPGGGEQLQLAAPADGSLAFDKTELTAAAGQATIELDNLSGTPHAVAIEGDGVDESSETVTGSKTSVSAELRAGEYTFYCPVGSHRDGGMEGTLTVE